jgi:21S rRNA (GM2251-2'-O)-methyltransferase
MDLEKTMGDGTVDDPRFKTMNDSFDPDFDDDDKAPKADVKPEAQFRSYLFVQDRSGGGSRKGSKATAAQEVMELAESLNVPIAYVDKGILNTLSGNRPHQGFVLRCGKMNFQGLSRIPTPDEADAPSLWLVLDEVVDPQNLGALLRSAYFLGGGTSNNKPKMGVLVCSKNSAPPSPVVSASSAGALELLEVHSTTNLPRTLQQAREDGFRIIGASSSIPTTTNENETDEGPSLYDLQDLPAPGVDGDDRPVILILGSEGHGLRTLVAKACTEFVRIPSGICSTDMNSKDDDDTSEAGVDSLNVSVTGGIMLWHLLHGRSK